MITSIQSAVAHDNTYYDQTYVVWPDNTVCMLEDLEEYTFMSDDYRLETSELDFESFIDSLD